MAEVTRRSFLKNSGLAMATAGVVSQIPLLGNFVTAGEADAPAATDAATATATATGESTATLAEPLVAHVRDLSTGEIGIFNGTREVIYHDPQLAARLLRASR